MPTRTEWTWCTMGRMPLIWRRRGSRCSEMRDGCMPSWKKEGILLPVVQLNLTYKKPARYDQELDVFTTVTAEPTTKLCLRCEVTHRGELLVVGEVVLVFVDANSGRPCRPPQGLTEKLHDLGMV